MLIIPKTCACSIRIKLTDVWTSNILLVILHFKVMHTCSELRYVVGHQVVIPWKVIDYDIE